MKFLTRILSTDIHRLLAGSALVQISGLVAVTLLGIQLARSLGPANYGIYGVIISIVSILTVIAQFGLPLLAIKEVASASSSKSHSDLRSVISWFYGHSLATSCVTLAIAVTGVFVWSPELISNNADLAILAGGIILCFSLLAVAIGIIRSAGMNFQGQAVEALAKPVLILAMVILVDRLATGVTVRSVLGAQLIASMLCLGYCVWAIHALDKRHPTLRAVTQPIKNSRYSPERWFGVSATFLSTSLLLVFNGNYPLLLAGFFVAPVELGIFRVALSSSVLLGLPCAIANVGVGPQVAKLHKEQKLKELGDNLAYTTVMTFFLTLIGFLLLATFGRAIVALLFGSEYTGAIGSLLILGAAQLVVSAFGVTGTYLNLTGQERVVIRAFFLSVPLGFAISIPLAWRYGIEGAATGNLLMVLTWHWYIFYRNRRVVGVPISIFSALPHIYRRRASTRHQW